MNYDELTVEEYLTMPKSKREKLPIDLRRRIADEYFENKGSLFDDSIANIIE